MPARKSSSRKAAPAVVAPAPKRGRLAVAASTLLAPRLGDAQALLEAGRKSADGLRLVLRRHRTILRESLSELEGVARWMRRIGPRESAPHLDKLARAVVTLSIDSLRDLAALASATQREALDILVHRLQEDLKQFRASSR
jgi:hypothetical protein